MKIKVIETHDWNIAQEFRIRLVRLSGTYKHVELLRLINCLNKKDWKGFKSEHVMVVGLSNINLPSDCFVITLKEKRRGINKTFSSLDTKKSHKTKNFKKFFEKLVVI